MFYVENRPGSIFYRVNISYDTGTWKHKYKRLFPGVSILVLTMTYIRQLSLKAMSGDKILYSVP